MFKQITQLIAKDFLLEWRQKYTFFGILLYVLSTIYITYLAFNQIIDVNTWNAVFWIILVFASVTTTSKSFLNESGNKQLFYYTLAKPQAIILAKTIYNGLLMIIISLLSYLIFSLWIGNIVENQLMFISSMLLGSLGFAATLTLVAGISVKAQNNSALMAILSFPLLAPMYITLIKVSSFAIVGTEWSNSLPLLGILALLNIIVVALSYLLFPYLWRD